MSMKANRDAYGKQMLAQFNRQTPTAEIIERDDDYIDVGSDFGQYFTEYKQWSALEKNAVDKAHGRILDIGCGAGRHSLYLQSRGFDVTGIDISPGAIKVCKLRGLQNAIVRPIDEIDKFKKNSFDTILMLGNNFGLFGSAENAKIILEKMFQITKPEAQIIAGTLNPHKTDNKEHLAYLRFNKRRGRMPGQIKMRIRYGKTVGEWFDYLFVSPEEMTAVIKNTNWQINHFIAPEESHYFAVIEKKSL